MYGEGYSFNYYKIFESWEVCDIWTLNTKLKQIESKKKLIVFVLRKSSGVST